MDLLIRRGADWKDKVIYDLFHNSFLNSSGPDSQGSQSPLYPIPQGSFNPSPPPPLRPLLHSRCIEEWVVIW
jgi:hypothetical protein